MTSKNKPIPSFATRSRRSLKSNLLRPIYLFNGFVFMILKRQRSQLGLTLLSLLSIILTIGLVTNSSFFSRAVDRLLLHKELADFTANTDRPAFSVSLDFSASSEQPFGLEAAEKFSNSIVSTLTQNVGLPLRHLGFQASSGGMLLTPDVNSHEYATAKNGFLDTVETVYIADVTPHIVVSEGKPFDAGGASKDNILDVWMNEAVAQKLGLKVGETFQIGVNLNSLQIRISIAGFYHPKGRENEFWFNDPEMGLSNVLIVRRQDFIRMVEPALPSKTRGVSWYVVLDDSNLNPSDAPQYLNGYKQSKYILDQAVRGITMNTAPLTPLEKFIDRSGTLTILLLTYNLPAFFILLFFLALISSILSRWQRKEMTLLVSRGMTLGGVLNYVLIEQLILFIVAVPAGIVMGMLFARWMGNTSSFLTFTQRDPLPVNIVDISIPLTVLSLAVTLLSRLWQAAQASQKSKVVEEREWARSTRAPFWHRYYLDLVMILPTYYFFDQMTKRGSLANLVSSSASDLFNDPLLILVPALFVVTGSLVIMRLFALLMSMLDLVASHTPWLALHLALRQLSRQSQEYLQPLLLVIITLAMGVYTLSMAASLDQWLVDRMYYQAGTDLSFMPMESSPTTASTNGNFVPPPSYFLTIPGVRAVARVGYLNAKLDMAQDSSVSGKILLLDRLDFPGAAWFRRDFASESLGGLMNLLALRVDGVLVPRELLSRTNLRIGDSLPATVGTDYSNKVATTFIIVGVYDYFPTVYQQDGVVLIGSMDNINNLIGFTVPHRLWLKLAPGADGSKIIKAISATGDMKAGQINDAKLSIVEEQARSERVGIFGTLTISFIATTIMSILGLLIYSYASLRERVYHLAMLLSMGVERAQIMAQVIMEYTFLSVFGVAAGALIGVLATRLFVPFFRFTGEKGAIPLPPLIPVITWQQIWSLVIVFTLGVVLAEIVTIVLSIRERIAQLLK